MTQLVDIVTIVAMVVMIMVTPIVTMVTMLTSGMVPLETKVPLIGILVPLFH